MRHKQLIIGTLTVLLGSCVSQDGIVTGIDGKPVRVTNEDIIQKRCFLYQVDDISDLHDKTEGTAIFEGVILNKQVDASSMVKAQVKTTWVLYGVQMENVLVETSEKKPYGIDFKIGEHYRIATYEDQGKLKTWTWMGTYSLKNKPECE